MVILPQLHYKRGFSCAAEWVILHGLDAGEFLLPGGLRGLVDTPEHAWAAHGAPQYLGEARCAPYRPFRKLEWAGYWTLYLLN